MDETPHRSGWKTALTIVTILALIGMGYALRTQIVDTFKNIGKVNTMALLLIIPLEVLNYHAQTKLYQGIFHVLNARIPYKWMYKVSLELNFINTIFPSAGVSGFSYFSVRMRGRQVSAAKATFGQMMKLILVFVSFQLMLFIGLIALAFDGRVSGLLILVSASLSTLLLVMTMVIAFIIGSKQRINDFFTFITKIINKLIHIIRRNNPETINISSARETFTELHENYMHLKQHMNELMKPLGYALLANLTEVAVIYAVYAAFGHYVNPGALIIAYAVANFAGLVSVLPGGVGIYEALMTAVLAAGGVSPSVSLPVTVMYRILSMLIQLIPGYILYHRALTEVSGVREVNEQLS